MDPIASRVAAGLTEAGIAFHAAANGHIRVPLPNGFGMFEIGATKDGSGGICGLVDDAWHTHGDLLGGTGIDAESAALVRFVRAVFAGEYLLIEERAPDQAPRRWIEDDLEYYLKNLPAGASYRIFNPPEAGG